MNLSDPIYFPIIKEYLISQYPVMLDGGHFDIVKVESITGSSFTYNKGVVTDYTVQYHIHTIDQLGNQYPYFITTQDIQEITPLIRNSKLETIL